MNRTLLIGFAGIVLLTGSCRYDVAAIVGGPEPPLAVTINSDITASGGPDVTYKRGMGAGGNGGFTYNVANTASIDVDTAIHMKIVNGMRNLYKEPGFGEFYSESGVYKHKQSAKYTDMRTYVIDKGLEMLNQIGGTPDNSATPLYPLALEYKDADLDYVPLPIVGDAMTAFQNNFTQWAINADIAAGGAAYHSIWIAHQEPTHTLGYINGVSDDAARQTNIRRFIDYWKPIAADLRAAGARVGGIQLNSDNTQYYQYMVDYLVQQNVALDFLTFQLYRWGEAADFTAAVSALDSFNTLMATNAKIIVNRGGWYKECCAGDKNQAISTSAGMIYYLRGERIFMDYADKVYAHIYDDQHTDLNLLEFRIVSWLNGMTSIQRRPLTNLPDGVDGFVLSTADSHLYAAIWNTSFSEYNITLQLDNSSFPSSLTPLVEKASGTAFTTVSGIPWDSVNKTIKTLDINTNEIILITLQ